jgi:hypothetical protein
MKFNNHELIKHPDYGYYRKDNHLIHYYDDKGNFETTKIAVDGEAKPRIDANDLIGRKFIYSTKYDGDIPFNIVGDGEMYGCVKVSTWEGRNANTQKLMNRTVGDYYVESIIKMINNKELIEK